MEESTSSNCIVVFPGNPRPTRFPSRHRCRVVHISGVVQAKQAMIEIEPQRLRFLKEGQPVPPADTSAPVPQPHRNVSDAAPPGDCHGTAQGVHQVADGHDLFSAHEHELQNVLYHVNTQRFVPCVTILPMDTSDKAVGDRLKAARIKASYETCEDAARAFGWVAGTVRSNENGNRRPSRKRILKYAAAYRVNAEWLESGVSREAVPLNEQEKALIDAFRGMTESQRTSLAVIIGSMASKIDKVG